MKTHVSIAGRLVGPGQRAYIVAELSGNHNGSLERALDSIRAAKDAGADAVKLQTYRADTITLDVDSAEFRVPDPGPWHGRTLYELYEKAHTPWEWHSRLFSEAKEIGLTIFSTPFDATAVELLEGLDSPAYKIASFELVDDSLLNRVARTGKPLIISTGMASLEEIAHALAVLEAARATEVIVLRCTSSYPAPDSAMNLTTIPLLRQLFNCPVGLSDHSAGTTAGVVATAFGASFIEKHFTLARADGGVDSHFSLEPAEFRQLVDDVRRAEAMLGTPVFGAGATEESSVAFRRSIYVARDVRRGEVLTSDSLRSIRPGYGLAPKYLSLVLGKQAVCDIRRGTPLAWHHVFSE